MSRTSLPKSAPKTSPAETERQQFVNALRRFLGKPDLYAVSLVAGERVLVERGGQSNKHFLPGRLLKFGKPRCAVELDCEAGGPCMVPYQAVKALRQAPSYLGGEL